jgi:hypothetical protein
MPYTIIRSTQFLEFLGGIADASTDGRVVRLAPGLFRLSRLRTLLPSSPKWPSLIHKTESSRLQARNERRSTKSSLAI